MDDKSDQKKEKSDYQDEVSDAVGDGGGCAEAWEATQELRSGGRRTFMASAIGALFSGASLSNVAAADATEDVPVDPEKSTSELSDSEKEELLNEAQSDDRFRAIWKKLRSEGLQPDSKSIVGYRTTFEDQEWEFIRMPFSVKDNDTLHLERNGDIYKSGGVIYNTLDEVSPHGYITTREVNYASESTEVKKELQEGGIDIDSIDTVPVVVAHTKYSADSLRTRGRSRSEKEPTQTSTVSAQSVEKESNSLTFPVASGGQVSAQGCECNSALANPLTACAPCGIPDSDCIPELANVYAVEIATCGTCVASSGWITAACATCLATIYEEDEFGFFCCPCDACDSYIAC